MEGRSVGLKMRIYAVVDLHVFERILFTYSHEQGDSRDFYKILLLERNWVTI